MSMACQQDKLTKVLKSFKVQARDIKLTLQSYGIYFFSIELVWIWQNLIANFLQPFFCQGRQGCLIPKDIYRPSNHWHNYHSQEDRQYPPVFSLFNDMSMDCQQEYTRVSIIALKSFEVQAWEIKLTI
jgi:hypothetical protein